MPFLMVPMDEPVETVNALKVGDFQTVTWPNGRQLALRVVDKVDGQVQMQPARARELPLLWWCRLKNWWRGTR
jgi:hypothetical protein